MSPNITASLPETILGSQREGITRCPMSPGQGHLGTWMVSNPGLAKREGRLFMEWGSLSPENIGYLSTQAGIWAERAVLVVILGNSK